MAELTTTSYAILSLLAVRPWTTYELARQMDRSVGTMWPRAQSVVYQEPKRLVAAGLASARTEHTGRRPRTVYTITADGRRALAAWLEEPGGPPSYEFEALLKVAFADQGSLEGLVANVEAVKRNAEEELTAVMARFEEYAETGGPYPDRLPVISLAARYYYERAEALRRWSTWAAEVIADWEGVTPETGASVATDAFRTGTTSCHE